MGKASPGYGAAYKRCIPSEDGRGRMRNWIIVVIGAALVAAPQTPSAWSRPGHMVSAAIAYDDLALHEERAVIDEIAQIIARHPDRGPFEVAQDRTSGRDRALRLLMECARWPDDARGTLYDHPTWHYASRPVIRGDAPTPPARDLVSGQAIEALELNFRVAANPRAPMGDRAVALCWVMHVAGDMHQPLHAASLYSATYADGDSGGNEQWVVDSAANEPVTLHSFWDDSVHQDGDPESVIEKAREIEARFSRASLRELRTLRARDFAGWSLRESFPLSALAFPPTFAGGPTRESAAALPAGYAVNAQSIAERRIAIAGYRLADLLREIASERVGQPR